MTTPNLSSMAVWRARLTLAVVLAVVAIVFIVTNRYVAPVSLLGIEVSLPMWIWFALLLGTGIVIGALRPWQRARLSDLLPPRSAAGQEFPPTDEPRRSP